ncbi:MAG: hypothetical protein ACPGJE_10580, partial [Wenzhouxiangellaceae bacterium]
TSPETRQECYVLGVDLVVEKPFDPDEFVVDAQALLNRTVSAATAASPASDENQKTWNNNRRARSPVGNRESTWHKVVITFRIRRAGRSSVRSGCS